MPKTKKQSKTIADVLGTRIAVIDAGNGSSTGVTNVGTHGIRGVNVQVARKDVTGLVDGSGADHIDIPRRYTWKGLDYVHGDDITFGGSSDIEETYGEGRYASDAHIMNIAVTLSELLQVPNNQPITLGIPVPPAVLIEDKTLPKQLRDKIGNRLHITLTEKGAEPIDYEYRIDKVVVMEELKSVRNLMTYDNCGQEISDWRERIAGRYLLLDQGAYTLNVAVLNNGQFEPLPVNVQSIRDLGLRMGVHDDIIKREKLRGVRNVDVDRALRGNRKINTVEGVKTISKDTIENAVSSHVENMISVLNTARLRFREFHGAILVGGGMELVQPYLDRYIAVVNDEKFHDCEDIEKDKLTALGIYRQLARKQG